MSIFKKECFQEYLYKRKFRKKIFDNHLDRKQWKDERQYDTRYVMLNSSK